jgi:TRAP-type C4-dicarboxylate transport system permease small subunit
MKKLERIAAFISNLSNVAGYIGLAGMFLLLLVVLTEIFLRTFFVKSLEFNITASMWLLVFLVWMGAAWTLKAGGHINVTLITSRFSLRSQHWMTLCTAAIALIFYIVFSWQALGLFLEHYSTGATDQSVWHIPKWYAWVPFCVGSIILTLQFFGVIIENLVSIIRLRQKQRIDQK